MRILLIGSTGQLGQALINSFPKDYTLISKNRSEFNLTKTLQFSKIIDEENPDWIINAGAYTNVENAEKESKLAYEINFKGVESLSKVLIKKDIKLLHLSTDYVFDGKKNYPYKTNDVKNPQNLYGLSKSLGEDSIVHAFSNKNQSIILRTSWLIGPLGKNFLLTILNLLKTKNELKIVNDQFGSMTNTFSLSKVIWALIEKNNLYSSKNKIFPNIHHWCDQGVISWFDLALCIKKISLEIGLLKSSAKIIPVSTSYFNFKAARPKYSVLDCTDTRNLISMNQKYWKESLFEILNSLKIRNYLN